MKIQKLTPAIGAEISNINLQRDCGPDVLEQIYQLLIDHLVLFFRDQDLCAKAHLAFARSFGRIDEPHYIYPHVDGYRQVVLLENDGDRLPDTNAWHTDLTYKPNPPFASVLHAKVIPPTGGDTLWASMYAAYQGLPDTLKAELGTLQAVHDPGSFRNQFLGTNRDIRTLNESLHQVGSMVHPVVKTHPVTGKPYLYVNQSFTHSIVGFSSAESDRLLRYLYDHINQPEYQIRFKWRQGDVAMWDNRVTQHYAVADYAPDYRRMHRVTVVDDNRVPPAG